MSRRFGRYLIKDEVADEIGRGGFGRVYRAFDPNVNRHVAIKVLSESDPELLSRFRDESTTAGQLEHENIVKVYDFDLQDGMPYLVMELLDGETLETIIRTKMIGTREIGVLDKVDILLQVARGLQHAHSENVIHRDIKPSNIMVLPNGTAKVMDFGIARVVDRDGTRRTRQGDLAGTMLYMAPEQFASHDADRRTDIFAYGVVCYELLTGCHPFFGRDAASVVHRITTLDPPPVRDKVPECPAALDAVIHRLLSKDREIRPDRLSEVVLDTQPILQQLRRERAAVLAAGIQPVVEGASPEEAQALVRQVLDLDPLNQVARQWREQLQQRQDKKAMRARAESLIRQGQEHVSARRFREALECLESAAKLDRSNATIQSAVEQVQGTIEKVRSAGRLLSEARAQMGRKQLESALEKVVEALDLDPADASAVHLKSDLTEAIRSAREADLLAQADVLRGGEEFAAALEVLNGAGADLSASPKIAALRAQVEAERTTAEIRRRQARLREALAQAREALYGQRLQEAGALADALCAEFREEPEAQELRSEVLEHLAAQKRQANIQKATRAAHALIKERRLDDARQVLDEALRAYPQDSGITHLTDLIRALSSAHDRAKKVGQAVKEAHALGEAGQLEKALQVLHEAAAKFGKDPLLVECRRNLEFEFRKREYARGLEARLDQARGILSAGNPAGAVSMLEEIASQYPGEPDVALLLSSARAALARRREDEVVSQTLAKAESLTAVEQFGLALSVVEAALSRHTRNSDLLRAAEELQLKLEDQERKRALAAQIRKIEEVLQAEDWEAATKLCEATKRDFPGEPALAELALKIKEAKRQMEIRVLQTQVHMHLSRQDMDTAERWLKAAQTRFSREAAWQELWREFERYREYQRELSRASAASSAGDYGTAEDILRALVAGAPDDRASQLLETVVAAQRRGAGPPSPQAPS